MVEQNKINNSNRFAVSKNISQKKPKDYVSDSIILVGIIIAMSIIVTAFVSNINYIDNRTILNDTLWNINSVTGNLEPVNFSSNTTVRVFDLIVESPASIKIGILNNVTFATISTSFVTSLTKNQTRFTTNINSDFVLSNNYNGTSYLANVNTNLDPLANAFVSASDPEFNGMTLNKWNLNHEDPYLNGLVGLFGNMEIRTTKSNALSSLGGNASNNIFIGFYDNATIGDEVSVSAYNGRQNMIEINTTRIQLNFDTHEQTAMYFNQTYTNTVPRTSPDLIDDKIGLFARDDGNLYIVRENGENGTIKRISVVGIGSSVFSEVVKFNNHTQFFGDVVLNNTVFKGGNVGYACIDEIGRLFKSVAPCHLTTDTYTQATIANSSMGEELANS